MIKVGLMSQYNCLSRNKTNATAGSIPQRFLVGAAILSGAISLSHVAFEALCRLASAAFCARKSSRPSFSWVLVLSLSKTETQRCALCQVFPSSPDATVVCVSVSVWYTVHFAVAKLAT